MRDRHARFEILEESETRIVIRDTGQHHQVLSVTNDAEWVVEQLAPRLGERQLLYYDTENQLDELLVHNRQFAGFKPGPR